MRFIIEHMDPDIFEWNYLEYRHISLSVGKKDLIFTNVKKNAKKLDGLGAIHEQSILTKEMQNTLNFNPQDAIILDPEAKETLTTEDCKKYKFLILGGILGDYPPQKRTKDGLSDKLKCTTRNLGKEQMSTDTAAYVAKKIADGMKLSDFRFAYKLEVETGDDESMELPYQYVIENNKPVLAPGFIEFISKWKGF